MFLSFYFSVFEVFHFQGLVVFNQEFVEARSTAGLNNAPLCFWSPTAPLELKAAPNEALSANAGFVTFGNI